MNTEPLDDFIKYLYGESRIGGGATLDELYDLAIAIRQTLELNTPPPQSNTKQETE